MKRFPSLRSLAAAVAACAAALPVSAVAADKGADVHVFLLTGQSNSLGAVKGTPAPQELLDKYRSQAEMWNGNMVRDTGVCFEKTPAWVPVAPQLPVYNGNPCMGPEYGFCHVLETRAPEVFKGKTAIIKASLDGGGNHFWQKGGKAYASMLATATAAMKASKGGTIEGLIYLQGESDAGDEVTNAGKRFPELFANLKKDIPAPKLKYAVVGQPATWHGKDKEVGGTTTAAQLEKMAAARKNTGWVRTRDLTKITSGDNMGVHYDGKSQITIGARFGYQMLMQMGVVVFDGIRNDNPDVTLDSPDAWWRSGRSESAKREPVTAVWDVAAVNAEETVAGTWTVSGIRVEDPFRAEIVINGKEGAKLNLGKKGIVLQDSDLSLHNLPVTVKASQTWKIPAGRTLTLDNVKLGKEKSAQIKLQGEGKVVLKGGTKLPGVDKGKVSVEEQ